MSPTIREATHADVAAFFKKRDLDAPTFRGWVGELDGRVIGIGGLARLGNGRWFAFLDLADEARPFKMTLMRQAKRTLEEARQMGIRYVYAEMNTAERNAEEWLTRLGFELDPRSQYLFRFQVPHLKP